LVKKFEDPSTPQGYERYQLKLQAGPNTDAAALWREYVDSVLFANFEVAVTSDDKRRAFGTGSRVIFTERRPGFDAKNRAGLPFTLPLSWDAYADAVAKGEPEGVETLARQISDLLALVADAAMRSKVETAIKNAGKDAAKLAAVKNRLEIITKGVN
jgi:hypothetical protein